MWAAGLGAVAALMVGTVYIALAGRLDVETDRRETVTRSVADDGTEVEVTTDLVIDAEQRVTRETLERLRNGSLVALALSVVLSIAVGRVIAGRVLAPIDQAMAARRRFVRDASHELRNPLAVMRTSLDLALEDPTTTAAGWREVGNGLRDSTDRMANVVDSLLRSARDEQWGAAATGTVDPADVLHRLAAQVRPAAAGRSVTVEVAAEPLSVPGDAAAVERAVGNLVDNALRAAPDGSVVLLDGVASATAYEIRVRDRGPGVPRDLGAGPEAAAGRIFERGHRSPDSPGLGLGLAIARDIVEAHGGTLILERSAADGATFLISLPLAPGRTPGDAAPRPPRGDA